MFVRICVAVCVFTSVADAQPRSPRSAGEAELAKAADEIRAHCDNAHLAIKVDWPAFERLDYQLLIAGREGGHDGNHAADPSYVAATKEWVLGGHKRRDDVPGDPITEKARFISEPLEQVCRDHKELRSAVGAITTIVIDPIFDMKYLSDRDTIAYARKANDWDAVEAAFAKETRDMDAELRAYRWRWKVSGATLTLMINVMARSGDTDDDVEAIVDAFSGGSAAAPRGEKAPPPPPPPSSSGDRDDVNGPAVDCARKPYHGLSRWSEKDTYATGAKISTYEGYLRRDHNGFDKRTRIYECVHGSGCHPEDVPGDTDKWTLVGHCAKEP
jgi:hypothetical protein